MADILDINDTEDLGVGDEGGDQSSVLRLKEKVLRRKGRGFEDEKPNGQYEEAITELGESAPMKSVHGWILFVTDVHEEASEEDLNEKFSEFGHLIGITINLDRRTGFLKGYAMIEFEDYEAADSARVALDGSDILGRTIQVNWCFIKVCKKNKRGRRNKKH